MSEEALAPWQGREREDFFAAVARHRRLTWRITAVCLFAYSLLAIVMAILLAPLLYCLAGLALDLLNKLTPMPDLLIYVGHLIAPIVDNPASLSLKDWLRVFILASTPGLILMLGVFWVVNRAVKHSALFDPQQSLGRPPNSSILAEQQFANTVAEMAIAAAIPAPNVVIIDAGANAAAVGKDAEQATIIVGQALLSVLTRQQMQGVAAHLVASIADNDLGIGLRTACLLGVFALITRLTVNLADQEAMQANRKLLKALFIPNLSNQAYLQAQLSDPFSDPSLVKSSSDREGLSWREWLIMPLMGPVIMSGFLGGFVNSLILIPTVAFAWRQRKYMADASAVKLTREPDGLSGALHKLQNLDCSLLLSTWSNHLGVLASGKHNMIVPIFPAIERRLSALVKLGANPEFLTPAINTRKPALWLMLLIGGLLTLAGGLILALIPMLALLSTMLTAFFTLIPTAFLHAFLR